MIECYECNTVVGELSDRSRCVHCEHKRAKFNEADNNALRERLSFYKNMSEVGFYFEKEEFRKTVSKAQLTAIFLYARSLTQFIEKHGQGDTAELTIHMINEMAKGIADKLEEKNKGGDS